MSSAMTLIIALICMALLGDIVSASCPAYFEPPAANMTNEMSCRASTGGNAGCHDCCPPGFQCCDDGTCISADPYCRYPDTCCAAKYCGERCCEGRGGTACGPLCAPKGHKCCDKTFGYTCGPKETCCREHCCRDGHTCCQGRLDEAGRCCPPGKECCNGMCCGHGHKCCGDRCCPGDCGGQSRCCPADRSCDSPDGAAHNCCALGEHCHKGTCCDQDSPCGNGCCNKGEVCNNAWTAGTGRACPSGSGSCAEAGGGACCPEGFPFYCAAQHKCWSRPCRCCGDSQHPYCCPYGNEHVCTTDGKCSSCYKTNWFTQVCNGSDSTGAIGFSAEWAEPLEPLIANSWVSSRHSKKAIKRPSASKTFTELVKAPVRDRPPPPPRLRFRYPSDYNCWYTKIQATEENFCSGAADCMVSMMGHCGTEAPGAYLPLVKELYCQRFDRFRHLFGADGRAYLDRVRACVSKAHKEVFRGQVFPCCLSLASWGMNENMKSCFIGSGFCPLYFKYELAFIDIFNTTELSVMNVFFKNCHFGK